MAWLVVPGGASRAQEQVSFSREIKPLLAKRCFSCHGPDLAESGLALHERDLALAVTDSGEAALVPGNAAASELLRRVASDDEDVRMPPEGEPLSQREITRIEKWIAQGADYQPHWAFLPLRKSVAPAVQDSPWVANPIDAFILAKLEAKGLAPSPPAEKAVLARRIYYDLIGLPPTLQQLQKFLDDKRPDAYQRLVEELLASPHYGEKWARHWLDVVRYGESNSYERDVPKPFVWKYRDYVIRAFNEDKPYDRFVREQIAGDELDEITEDSITATGYYRIGTWDDEPADPLQAKYDDLDNILSTTSQALLGLTVGCARCHDHKIDPVPQADYYGMLAFFADVTPYALPHQRDAKHHSLWDFSDSDAKARRQAVQKRVEEISAALRQIEDEAIKKMDASSQRRAETRERVAVLREKLHVVLSKEAFEAYLKIMNRLDEAKEQAEQLPKLNVALALAKCEPNPQPMHIMMRGNPHVPGDTVVPHFPVLFGDDTPQIPEAEAGARSAGRRKVLAQWMTRPGNMLFGRVIVNRVWQHHFGRGIVRSANNFGQLGTPPTHPELLDWLALWLEENQWSLKSLHRLILTSNTYQMSSAGNTQGLAADPENNLFWRFDMRRLTAEEIRDSVLHVSGELNPRMHGPSIYPKLSEEVLATQSRPGENWNTSTTEEAARRSVYIHIKRSLIPPELANFDFPDTDTSCAARFDTIQAAQSLNLLHSEFLQTQAKHFAERVKDEAGSDLRARVTYTLRLALQRDPDEPTIEDGLALITELRGKHGLKTKEAMLQYCLMVLNLNGFVYLD